jgi:hypothetical protein
MIALYFLIGALAVLVSVSLFGFVGCNWFFGLEETTLIPPTVGNYPDVIKGEPGLVAYWRLGDTGTVPTSGTSGGAAKDELGNNNGDYFKLNPVTFPDTIRHSPAIPMPTVTLGDSPGLLQLAPLQSDPCIYVYGGFMRVQFDSQLNPASFTFEALVYPDSGLDPTFPYCLVESTGPPGPQGTDPKKTGWGLYLGPSDINNPNPAGPLLWQVWMGDGTQLQRVAIAKPDFPKKSDGTGIPISSLTYLALTFDGQQKLQLFVFHPDNNQDLTFENLQALTTPIPSFTFKLNGTSSDGQGNFFIGTGSTLFPIFGAPPQRLYPFKGKIQEVALYNKDLSAPDNAGIMTSLTPHVTSGLNL